MPRGHSTVKQRGMATGEEWKRLQTLVHFICLTGVANRGWLFSIRYRGALPVSCLYSDHTGEFGALLPFSDTRGYAMTFNGVYLVAIILPVCTLIVGAQPLPDCIC